VQVDKNDNDSIEFSEFVKLMELLKKVAEAGSAFDRKFLLYCQVRV
jgi:hypothetical protein